jgi:uncharacterized protein YbaR (Trm112 family)
MRKRDKERDKEYEIKYTPKELKYKLFGKKICPVCKSKLVLSKEKEFSRTARGMSMSSISGMSLGRMVDVYQITEYYCCEQCNRKFTITELTEGK